MSQRELPIFVISLARARERRAYIQKQMGEHGLMFEFFDAVDGNALTPEQEELVDHDWEEKRSGPALSPQLLGCSISHALLYDRMVQDGIEKAIILEDDAVITPKFKALVDAAFFQNTRENLVVLHSYRRTWARRGFSEQVDDETRLYRFHGRALGTCGYFLQMEAARILREAAMPIWTVPDWPLDISKTLDAKGIEPPPILHGEDQFSSQIQEFSNRRIPKFVKLMRLLVIPSLMFPKRFGGYWKSRYTWEAAFFQCKAHLFARKPIQYPRKKS